MPTKATTPQPALAGDWQLIDTAPPDTQDILAAFAPGGRQLVVHRTVEGGGFVAGDQQPVTPTHWQPLPSPPAAAPAPPLPAAPPVLTSLDPATAALGDPDVTLHVYGTGFAADAVIHWNEVPLPTAVVSATEVTTTISPGTAQVAMAIPVLVQHGDGPPSNALTFTLTEG
jgi:hypothetical protein